MEDTTELAIMTAADFDAFMAEQVVWLKDRMAEKPHSVMPYLAIKTMSVDGNYDLTICAIDMNFNEHAEKKSILMQLGRKTYGEQVIPTAIALSCEAWVARNPPPGVRPRDFEGKQEVVMVAAETLGQVFGKGFSKVVSIPVTRDDQNRMVMQDEDHWLKAETAKFPLLDYFYRGFFEVAMAAKGGAR